MRMSVKNKKARKGLCYIRSFFTFKTKMDMLNRNVIAFAKTKGISLFRKPYRPQRSMPTVRSIYVIKERSFVFFVLKVLRT